MASHLTPIAGTERIPVFAGLAARDGTRLGSGRRLDAVSCLPVRRPWFAELHGKVYPRGFFRVLKGLQMVQNIVEPHQTLRTCSTS